MFLITNSLDTVKEDHEDPESFGLLLDLSCSTYVMFYIFIFFRELLKL